MKKDILFTLPSYFRDDMNIMAYRFGKGEKTCAVVGALRGDEVQQLYVHAPLARDHSARAHDALRRITPTGFWRNSQFRYNGGGRIW